MVFIGLFEVARPRRVSTRMPAMDGSFVLPVLEGVFVVVDDIGTVVNDAMVGSLRDNVRVVSRAVGGLVVRGVDVLRLRVEVVEGVRRHVRL